MIDRVIDVTEPDDIDEPVTLEELKAWLRIDTSAEDDLLTELITAAREAVEMITRRTIAQRQCKLTLDRFPRSTSDEWWDGVREGAMNLFVGQSVVIPRPPLVTIDSVTTYNDADTASVLADTSYFTDASDPDQFGRLALRTGNVWPVVLRTRNGVEIVFTAGYSSVPASLKFAIKKVAAHMYSNRGDCSEEACKSVCGEGIDRYIVRRTV
jgi:hypothetical protein